MKKMNICIKALMVSVLVLSLLAGCSKDSGNDDASAVEQSMAEEVPVITVQPLDEPADGNVIVENGVIEEETDTKESGKEEQIAEVTEAEAGNEAEAAAESVTGADSDMTSDGETGSVATAGPANLANGAPVGLNPDWTYAGFSKINSGAAVYYAAPANQKGITVGVNAGHGTKGGGSVKTYCHPDMTPKVTGGSTAAGSIEATAVSSGMAFNNGESEAAVNLRLAQFLKAELLSRGYDVLMIRDGDDVQLDNVARTVICNNMANCHIAIHFDGDGTGSDKGCFYSSVPDALKSMEPVATNWSMSEALGDQIMNALSSHGHKLYHGGSMDIDLTQTSYSSVPSVDVEYGNQCSDTSDANLADLAKATADGVDYFFQMVNL